MNMKYILMSGLALSLAACASTPKVEPVVDSQPVQEQQPPQVFEPEPIAPTQPLVTETMPPIPAGPTAGTVDHFKYIAGDDRVYFAYNRYELSSRSRDVLRLQAAWLNEYSSSILVVGGNADERGTREYNLALGARRADSVKAFLVSQGVNPSRITTVSYGKERPIDGRSNEAAWSLNRNAHSAILVGGSS